MKIKDIIAPIERFAPLAWQEDYDNSGLVVGHPDDEVTAALICVDATPEVLDEAERLGARLVISHHPIIFRPIKRLTGSTRTEQITERAIRSRISLYACHTNLDSAPGGMSFRLAAMLGIGSPRVLAPLGNVAQRDEVATAPDHRPITDLSVSRQACCPPPEGGEFRSPGACLVGRAQYGFGVIGTLATPQKPIDYLREVQRTLRIKVIRHSELTDKPITKVAICSGSAAPLIPEAQKAGAELFMAADFKYNDFFALTSTGATGGTTQTGATSPETASKTAATAPFMVADIGHWESEFCAIDLIYEIISKKIPNFALHKSASERNPVNYLV